MKAVVCPDVHALAALLEKETPEEVAAYSAHLESCVPCQQTLADLADDSATWEEATRYLPQLKNRLSRPAACTPALERVMMQLKNQSPLLSRISEETIEEELSLSILRPADRDDLLGYLGDYEVQEVLGRGGMGVVFKAFEPALHRLVAIKVMAAAVAGSAVARLRFKREAQAAAAVCHDHLVTVFGVYETDGLPYLVMQYVAGESLQARLDRSGPLEVVEVVRIGLQTASGLAAAHAQGLIHRDVKPANLLLENGLARVRITDFGLARMVDDSSLTQHGVVAGTPEYMAPEQARGEPVDHRADLFSLGSVLYAMNTGKPPFRGSLPIAVLRQVSDQAPRSLRSLNPDVPAWLETLIARLMAKNPADRCQSAAEVAALLEGYLAHLRQPATVPAPELPPSPAGDDPARPQASAPRVSVPRWQRSAPMFFVVAGCLVLAVLALALGQHGLAPKPASHPPGLLGSAPLPEHGAQELEKTWKVFRQDFRRQPVSDQFFLYTGVRRQIVEEAEGLRISLPGDHPKPPATGLVLHFPIKGDCAITTSYELLQANKPARGWGVGVTLYAMTDTPTKEAVMLSRVREAEGNVFECHRIGTDATGKRLFNHVPFPAETRAGKLRLVRRGTTVTYLVADPGQVEFRELYQAELGKEDLILVRVAAESGNSDSPVEVRILDFEVRAADLPTAALAEGPEGSPASGGMRWLTLLGFLGLATALGLALSVGLWRTLRQGRSASPQPAPGPVREGEVKRETEASPISFVCSTCGKRLKAKAALAGKKVKCSQCGQAVLVPGSKTGEAGSISL